MKKLLLIVLSLSSIFALKVSASTSYSYSYQTTYQAWERTWTSTYSGSGYSYHHSSYSQFHSNSTVYIRETKIREFGTYYDRTRVEVFSSRQNMSYNSPVRTYYTHNNTIYGCHGNGHTYYNPHYYNHHSYYQYHIGFDSAADKIVTGTVAIGVGGVILAGADSSEEALLGAAIMVSGSASKAKGYEQDKFEKTQLYKALEEEQEALEDGDIDF